MGNFNCKRYISEVLQPDAIPCLQRIPGAVFQQHNVCPYVAKITQDFFSVEHVQLLLWSVYSPDIPPIKHTWDFVGQRLACDPRPIASTQTLGTHTNMVCSSPNRHLKYV